MTSRFGLRERKETELWTHNIWSIPRYATRALAAVSLCLLWCGLCKLHIPTSHIDKSTCDPVPLQLFSNPSTSFRENLGLFVEEAVCHSGRGAKVIDIGVWRGAVTNILFQRYHKSIDEWSGL